MINLEKELNKESEKYKIISNIKIIDDDIIFNYENEKYILEFYELIKFMEDYYCYDSFVCNFDLLCELIEDNARNYNITTLINLFEGLNYSNINDEYFIIDGIYNNVYSFNDLEELNCIYNIIDILEEICEGNKVEDYCEKLDSS